MVLSFVEIQKRIKEPKNEALLQRAQFDNNWCRFHSRLSTRKEDTGEYYSYFEKKIKKILTDVSKQEAFFELLPFPFPTTRFISEVQDELNKVFYANDKQVEIEFVDEKIKEDYELFLEEEFELEKVMDKVYNLAFESPNSVLVMDSVPTNGEQLPKPYGFFLQPKEIIDIELDEKGKIVFILFWVVENERIGYIDTEVYAFIEKSGQEWVMGAEVAHNIGYCPAAYLWPDMIEGYGGLRRNGLMIPVLSDLDRILRGHVFEDHADLYAAHPIMQVPDSSGSCEIEGCQNGYIERINSITGEKHLFKCECQSGKSVGPGTTIEVPAAAMAEGIGEVVKFIESPVATLEYFTGKVNKLKEDVFLALTGGNYSQVTKEAINEKQVQQGSDRKRNRYIYLSEQLEQTHQFIIDTAARIRYGVEYYLGSIVKYGVEFDLETLTDAVERYNMLKNAGLPQYILGQQIQVIENLFSRSNSEYERRISMMRLLEPYRNVPINLVPMESLDYIVKLRFLEFIDEFESKYGSILSYQETSSLPLRIENIKKELYTYAESSNQRIRKDLGGLPTISQGGGRQSGQGSQRA